MKELNEERIKQVFIEDRNHARSSVINTLTNVLSNLNDGKLKELALGKLKEIIKNIEIVTGDK